MNKKAWLLIVIIIIASFLRLANINTAPPGLYPDEAINGNNAVEVLSTKEFSVFYPENNGREGLFINIQSLSVAALGNEPYSLRIPSAIFGILTVLGIYFLAKELFNGSKNTALLASFLAATSFWHIVFSRIGFRAIMAPFFLVWASYFILLALRKRESGGKFLPFLLLPGIGGIMYGLGFHSYIAYRATPLIFLALLPFYYKKKWFYGVAAVFLLFTIAAVLPLGTYFIQNPADFFGRTAQISIFDSPSPIKDLIINKLKTLGMLFFAGDSNWRHNLSGRPELYWPVGIMFIFGVFDGVRSLFRKLFTRRQSENALAYTFLFLWFAVAMLPVIISNEGIPHALRAILMIPPTLILASAGGISIHGYLKKRVRNEMVLKAASTALLIILTIEAYNTYFGRWATDENTIGAFNQNYVDIAGEINDLPSETQKIVVVNAGGVLVRGVPMPAQTVMFLTDSFIKERRDRKNISYVIGDDFNESGVPGSAVVFFID